MHQSRTLIGNILLLGILASVCSGGNTVPTTTPAAGLPNPASAYCEEQDGTVDIRSDEAGNQYGICVFTDGSECDEWAYYRGECAPGQ